LGQSIWLDNITREILDNGTLRRYIGELSVTGPHLEPDHIDEAIGKTSAYDGGIPPKGGCGSRRRGVVRGIGAGGICGAPPTCSGLNSTAAAASTGWVSMEVSPLIANDTKTTIDAALRIHKQANRPNLYIKIPGTPAGVPAIEEAIFAGVPVNVTLLFSREHYLAVSESLPAPGSSGASPPAGDPQVGSVASLFVSRWDRAIADKAPRELRNRLGIAIAGPHLPGAIANCWRVRAGVRSRRPAPASSAHALGQHRPPRIPRPRGLVRRKPWRRPTP